jgi:hypothetical protein
MTFVDSPLHAFNKQNKHSTTMKTSTYTHFLALSLIFIFLALGQDARAQGCITDASAQFLLLESDADGYYTYKEDLFTSP